MRRHTRVLMTWTFMSCFVFMIIFNFYVNVWTLQDDIYLSEHLQHSNSSYIWVKSNNIRTMVSTSSQRPSIRDQLRATDVYSAKPETSTPSLRMLPDLQNYDNDRILSQLEFKPTIDSNGSLKKILLFNGFDNWGVKPGRQSFLEQKCPVNSCELTDNVKEGPYADAVLFRQEPKLNRFKRPPHQIWILFLLESPHYTPSLKRFANMFNWTATYRRDSDIVAPYEKYVKHKVNSSHIQPPLSKNYAKGKTKKVAWFASNCVTPNARIKYVRQLSRYIQVDVYGKCGKNRCPRGASRCSSMLDNDYKFYLSFENSNCRDYITEKFFVTGLQHDVVPIVMGAAPEDYRRAAPHYSYIHVDEYTGPRQLADYLNELDKDDDAYSEYFRWKDKGSFINTYFWCRICAMLHDPTQTNKTYGNIDEWWRGRDVCIGSDRWGQHPRTQPYISNYYNSLHT